MKPEGSLPHSKEPQHVPILSEVDRVHGLPSHIFKIHFHSAIPSTPRSITCSLPFLFPHQNSTYTSLFPDGDKKPAIPDNNLYFNYPVEVPSRRLREPNLILRQFIFSCEKVAEPKELQEHQVTCPTRSGQKALTQKVENQAVISCPQHGMSDSRMLKITLHFGVTKHCTELFINPRNGAGDFLLTHRTNENISNILQILNTSAQVALLYCMNLFKLQ